MTRTMILLGIALFALAGCQTIPTERTNNCACQWDAPQAIIEGATA